MSDDWDLLERARKRDDTAWRLLIQRHNPSLTTMTFLITGSMDAAKDIVQEAFVRLVRSAPKHHYGSFKAYLSTIAYRLALKDKQRTQRYSSLEGIVTVDDNPGALETVLKKERDVHLTKIVRSLEPKHRDVLILRFYGGHSYEEIADETNVPLGTVKSRIFYAVKACREAMQAKGLIE
jgi:RNA polymerase sigma-70 factor (ECF subfamily)